MPQNNQRTAERGNVFLLILLGVVIFAALSFVIARGMRTDTTGQITGQKAALAASEILNFAQRVGRAVNKIRRNNISESDLSFENNGNFVNTNCNDGGDPEYPACQIFNTDGGRIRYDSPDPAITSSEWHFTGATCIAGLGSGETGCDSDTDTRNEELLLVLSDIGESVCTEINKRLNITGIPANTGAAASSTTFSGSFADNAEIILAGGPYSAACYSRSGQNDFYFTLIER